VGIEGMTFVITGAARGIGAATARVAASRGANIVLSDLLDDDGEKTAAAIRDAGGQAVYAHCDVTSPDDVAALMATAEESFGGIDVLHNNAGVHESMLTEQTSLESMSVETFRRILDINLVGSFLCAKAALPLLRRSTRGPSIINAGSIAGWVGTIPGIAYGSSKAGIALLTKNLAVDLAGDGIRVNCYCPAAVETEMVAEVVAAAPDPVAVMNTLSGSHLVRRIGSPDDVGKLVCFLASDDAAFINGVVWLIDGGSLAWRGTLDVLGLDVLPAAAH
jgi:NAD(P)-dependent dehydrogenase (short-subunit alcohol dehydrogenase family)